MGLLHELLLTAIIAALMSFILAKLVSAVVGTDHNARDMKFKDSGVVVEEKGMKIEAFEGVTRIETVDHAVVEKVKKIDGDKKVEVSGTGLPEKPSEESSGEEGKGFDREDIKSVDKDGYFVEESREFGAKNDEQSVEVKRESVIYDDEVKDGEFSAKDDELRRDVIDDEVKDGEFIAKYDELKRDVIDDEVKDGEYSAIYDELRRYVINNDLKYGEFSAEYEELKSESVIDDEVKDGEISAQDGKLKTDVIDDEVKDGEFSAEYEELKSESVIDAKVKDGEISAQDGKLKTDVIEDEVKDGEFSAQDDELKRDVIDDEVKDGEFNAQKEVMRDAGNSEVKDDEMRDGEANESVKGVGDEKGVSKEVLWTDDDDDGWEGIEITEMEKIFAEATKFVASKDNIERVSSFGRDVLMELDALHKVVAEGPCLDPQPMALKVSARAKWDARQRLGNMNPDTALEQYVTLLSQQIPGWMEETSENIKSGIARSDSTLSTSPHHHPHSTVERPLEPASGVKEGDLVEATHLDKKEIK